MQVVAAKVQFKQFGSQSVHTPVSLVIKYPVMHYVQNVLLLQVRQGDVHLGHLLVPSK